MQYNFILAVYLATENSTNGVLEIKNNNDNNLL